ncbi:hexose kinase [Loigolactobacillus binensis]|uniref:Tagatose-6-phosphate kinase n=1 Tax=Loigolactobacillus binensis TaxID=2559922 RepID=A0ABW3EHW8_9LACO|nr:hexose kinase [Loigolactobacillus binensis]
MILTVTMNPSIDVSYPLNHLKIDDVNRTTEVSKTAGGKGLNVSRVIQQLGTKILATGIIGGFFGQFIETKLSEDHIEHNFYKIDQESRECIAILHDGGNQTEILESGPVLSEEEKNAFLNHYNDLLAQSSLVTISGSLPSGVNPNFYALMVRLAHGKGKKVLLDTSGESLKTALLSQEKPDLIKPNEEELQQLIPIELNIHNPESLKAALSTPDLKDVEWICVSLGKAGAFVKHGSTFYSVSIPAINVVNPVGSGDATLAGLAVAIDSHQSDEVILKTAMTTGMLNTMERQTGFIDSDKFDEYFKKVLVTQV